MANPKSKTGQAPSKKKLLWILIPAVVLVIAAVCTLLFLLPGDAQFRVTPGNATLDVGQTQKLELVAPDGSRQNLPTRWYSEIPTVAVVNSDGVVTASAAGTTKVTAIVTYKGMEHAASAFITVTGGEAEKLSVAGDVSTQWIPDPDSKFILSSSSAGVIANAKEGSIQIQNIVSNTEMFFGATAADYYSEAWELRGTITKEAMADNLFLSFGVKNAYGKDQWFCLLEDHISLQRYWDWWSNEYEVDNVHVGVIDAAVDFYNHERDANGLDFILVLKDDVLKLYFGNEAEEPQLAWSLPLTEETFGGYEAGGKYQIGINTVDPLNMTISDISVKTGEEVEDLGGVVGGKNADVHIGGNLFKVYSTTPGVSYNATQGTVTVKRTADKTETWFAAGQSRNYDPTWEMSGTIKKENIKDSLFLSFGVRSSGGNTQWFCIYEDAMSLQRYSDWKDTKQKIDGANVSFSQPACSFFWKEANQGGDTLQYKLIISEDVLYAYFGNNKYDMALAWTLPLTQGKYGGFAAGSSYQMAINTVDKCWLDMTGVRVRTGTDAAVVPEYVEGGQFVLLNKTGNVTDDPLAGSITVDDSLKETEMVFAASHNRLNSNAWELSGTITKKLSDSMFLSFGVKDAQGKDQWFCILEDTIALQRYWNWWDTKQSNNDRTLFFNQAATSFYWKEADTLHFKLVIKDDVLYAVFGNDTHPMSLAWKLPLTDETYGGFAAGSEYKLAINIVDPNNATLSNITVKTGDGVTAPNLDGSTSGGEGEDLAEEDKSLPLDAQLLEALSGKYVSILGDSISTYSGLSTDTDVHTGLANSSPYYQPAYTEGMDSENNVYWGKILAKYDMNLLVNNSFGGTRLTNYNNGPAGYLRVEDLSPDTGALTGVKPDVIILFMGTNDRNAGVPLGELTAATYTGVIQGDGYITPTTFTEAYIITIDKISKLYPDAQVMALTLIGAPEDNYNNRIRELADHYENVTLVDIARDSGILSSNAESFTYDKIHPNVRGMNRLSIVLEKALKTVQWKASDNALTGDGFTLASQSGNVSVQQGDIVTSGKGKAEMIFSTAEAGAYAKAWELTGTITKKNTQDSLFLSFGVENSYGEDQWFCILDDSMALQPYWNWWDTEQPSDGTYVTYSQAATDFFYKGTDHLCFKLVLVNDKLFAYFGQSSSDLALAWQLPLTRELYGGFQAGGSYQLGISTVDPCVITVHDISVKLGASVVDPNPELGAKEDTGEYQFFIDSYSGNISSAPAKGEITYGGTGNTTLYFAANEENALAKTWELVGTVTKKNVQDSLFMSFGVRDANGKEQWFCLYNTHEGISLRPTWNWADAVYKFDNTYVSMNLAASDFFWKHTDNLSYRIIVKDDVLHAYFATNGGIPVKAWEIPLTEETFGGYAAGSGYQLGIYTVDPCAMTHKNVTVLAGDAIDDVVDTSWDWFGADSARSRADEYEARGNNGKTTLVIGDSFFDIAFWDKFYTDLAGKDAIIAGIGGTTAHDWMSYIKYDLFLNGIAPKNLVINIGNNDIFNDGLTAQEAAAQFQELIEKLHEMMPQTNIYLFSITGRSGGYTNATAKANMEGTNAAMKAWCGEAAQSYVTFVDIAAQMTADKLYDNIHPKDEYYSSIFLPALLDAGCVIEDEAVYSITYEGLEGAENTNPATYTLRTAADIQLVSPGTRENYVFVRWELNGEAVTSLSGRKGNLVLKAVWADANASYSITYTDGGTHTNPATYEPANAGNIKLKPAQKDGYVFLGWFIDGAWVTDLADRAGDLEITAKWVKQVGVGGGGSASTADKVITETSAGNYQTNGADYEFEYYFFEPASVDFEVTTTFKVPTTSANDWMRNAGFVISQGDGTMLLIKFTNNHNGSTNRSCFVSVFNSTRTISETQLTANFQMPKGTSTTLKLTYAEGLFSIYDANNTLLIDLTVEELNECGAQLSGDAPFAVGVGCGQWAEATFTNVEHIDNTDDSVRYTISYELDGGTNPENAPTQYTEEKAGSVTLPTPTKAGHNFLGWYIGETQITSLAGKAENVTLTAKWEKQRQAITYDEATGVYNVANGSEVDDGTYFAWTGKSGTDFEVTATFTPDVNQEANNNTSMMNFAIRQGENTLLFTARTKFAMGGICNGTEINQLVTASNFIFGGAGEPVTWRLVYKEGEMTIYNGNTVVGKTVKLASKSALSAFDFTQPVEIGFGNFLGRMNKKDRTGGGTISNVSITLNPATKLMKAAEALLPHGKLLSDSEDEEIAD